MEILGPLRLLFDGWEYELTGSHSVANRTTKRMRNYWVTKNILICLLLHSTTPQLTPLAPLVTLFSTPSVPSANHLDAPMDI